MSKVQIVLDHYKFINEGKHDEAAAQLHEDCKATTTGASGITSYNKTESTKGLKEAHEVAKVETVITDAKEINGKVVVVGKTVVKIKAGAPSDHAIVKSASELSGSAVPFKAIFEFSGDKIINCEGEGEVGGSYSCTL